MPDAKTFNLSEAHLHQIAKEAAQSALSEYGLTHKCLLNEDERGLIHALHEISKEEKANHGHWRVLIQWGVNISDVTKQIRKSLLWVFISILAGFAIWFKTK